MEASVPVFNHRVCNEVFSLAGLDEKLTDTFICAGLREGGVDACKVCSETKHKPGNCAVAYFPSFAISCSIGVYLRLKWLSHYPIIPVL